jgi:hypothetical protein
VAKDWEYNLLTGGLMWSWDIAKFYGLYPSGDVGRDEDQEWENRLTTRDPGWQLLQDDEE